VTSFNIIPHLCLGLQSGFIVTVPDLILHQFLYPRVLNVWLVMCYSLVVRTAANSGTWTTLTLPVTSGYYPQCVRTCGMRVNVILLHWKGRGAVSLLWLELPDIVMASHCALRLYLKRITLTELIDFLTSGIW
jgi:hypothetical protein